MISNCSPFFIAIDFIMDPTFNLSVAGGATKFLFVESSTAASGSHRVGKNGIVQSGYIENTHFVHADASTLDLELDKLGTVYGGLVIASDFGGLLRQAELDILNTRSADIIDFLNIDNGGLYAMAEGNGGDGLTPALPLAWSDLLAVSPWPLVAATVAVVAARLTTMRLLREFA